MKKEKILSAQALAGAGKTVGKWVECLDIVDSTNTYLKHRAAQGAPHGTVVLAREQTGGRGRLGRSFRSERDKGLYLSVLLRPAVLPAQAAGMTAWAAVAVCRAVERCTGLRPGIKWVNDLQLEGKKLCGILSEMELDERGTLRHVIVGVGINLGQTEGEFPPEIAEIATSLAMHMPQPPSLNELARVLIEELDRMASEFPEGREAYLEEYRKRCVTVGKPVEVISPLQTRRGFALGVDEEFNLTVRFGDGSVEAVGSGEVSVRI